MLFIRKSTYILFCCLFIISCGEKREIISGEGPIVEVHRYEHSIYVYTGPGAKRTDFIKMDKFGDFRPGISPLTTMLSPHEEAEKLHMGASPSEGVVYVNRSGRIRITSENGVYPLYFIPHDRRPDLFLTQLILKYINHTAKEETVLLFECGFEQPYISVIFEDGQLQEVVWIDDGDLSKRSDQSQCTD